MATAAGGNNPVINTVSAETVSLWATMRRQIHRITGLLTIDGPVFTSWNPAEKAWIYLRYRSIVHTNVIYVRDCQCDRIFLSRAAMFPPGSITTFTVGNVAMLLHPKRLGNLLPPPPPENTPIRVEMEIKGVKLGKTSKILRPPNAFILYRKAHHESVKAAHPGIHNNQISVILGTQWQNEDVAVRAEYKAEALQLKMEHMTKYPDYQYQPRKSSELKRRMTKKKAAAIGQPEAVVTNEYNLDSSPLSHDFSQVLGSWTDFNGLDGHLRPLLEHGVQANDLLDQIQLHNSHQKILHPVEHVRLPEVFVGDNEWLMSVSHEFDVPWAIMDEYYPQPELEDKYNPWI